MNKAELRSVVHECIEHWQRGQTSRFWSLLTDRILTQKIQFPYLEFVGHQLHEQLPATALAIADELVDRNYLGSYVISGIILQHQLPNNADYAWQKAIDYMIAGNEWYTCDIIAERVFGQSLLLDFDATVPFLEQCQEHPNLWIKRSVGIAVHLATKRPIEDARAHRLMQLCLRQAHEKAVHIKKGCGWGIETIAKNYPHVAESYRSQILDDPAINAWNKRKLLMGFEKGERKRAKAAAK